MTLFSDGENKINKLLEQLSLLLLQYFLRKIIYCLSSKKNGVQK